jgi:hypothetical protein
MLREDCGCPREQVEQHVHETVTVRTETMTVERFDREGRPQPTARE